MKRRAPFLSLLFTAILSLGSSAVQAAEPGAIENDLVITVQGEERHVSLDEALKLLDIPSASLALIDEGRIAFASAYGKDATPDTVYQAASLSKFVAAIGAMRLVEDGTLDLDQDVNDKLTSWRVPGNALRRDPQGHLARAAQHDRRHRRAWLPRLRGRGAPPHAAGKFSTAPRRQTRRRSR